MAFDQKALKKNYPEAYQKALGVSESAAREITMLIAMFNIIARKEGKEDAYNFLKKIFQEVAIYSMPALYQIDDLRPLLIETSILKIKKVGGRNETKRATATSAAHEIYRRKMDKQTYLCGS